MSILLGIGLVGVLIGTIITFKLRNERLKLWRSWTAARGWIFSEHITLAEVGGFRGGPFNRGRRREASWAYRGTFDGLPVHGFEYEYETGSGEDSTTHNYHVDVVRLGGSFPSFRLCRENWLSRAVSSDLQFENAAFNREWNVASASPRFAHDVIHPRMMEWMMSDQLWEFQELWLENGCLVVNTKGARKPEHVDAYLRLLTQFVSRIPRFTLDECGVGPLQVTQAGPARARGTRQLVV